MAIFHRDAYKLQQTNFLKGQVKAKVIFEKLVEISIFLTNFTKIILSSPKT